MLTLSTNFFQNLSFALKISLSLFFIAHVWIPSYLSCKSLKLYVRAIEQIMPLMHFKKNRMNLIVFFLRNRIITYVVFCCLCKCVCICVSVSHFVCFIVCIFHVVCWSICSYFNLFVTVRYGLYITQTCSLNDSLGIELVEIKLS